MNDFRWEVIWLISGVVEGVVALSIAGLLMRAERWRRKARQRLPAIIRTDGRNGCLDAGL
jgi:hypothetical protein